MHTNKTHKTFGILGVTLIALMPALANAALILDSGPPTNPTNAPVSVLNTTQWLAAEFDVTSLGITIDEIGAYLTQGAGQPNDTYTIDIYSNTGFTNRASSRPAPVYTTTGVFSANGWNQTGTAWTPSATGLYWVTLQVSSTTQTHGLDAPGAGISTSSGTAPAMAFAFAGTSGQFSVESMTSPTTPFGVQIDENPVPLPAAAWLLLSGFGGIGALARRRLAA